MIPLALLGKVPWRLVGYAALAAAVLFAGWRIREWREAYLALPIAQKALTAEQNCDEGSKCAERALQAVRDARNADAEVVSELRNDLATIRAERDRAYAIGVRCYATRPSDVRVPEPAPGTDGAAPGADVPAAAGSDIVEELRDLARDADIEVAKRRQLQNWNRAMAQE